MALGLTCRECKKYRHTTVYMFAQKEEDQPKGRYVTYVCQKCGWSERIFEKYAC